MKNQVEMLKIAKHLERKGHIIAEVYNEAGFLQVFVDGEHKTLGDLFRLWRFGK